jgi:transposase
MEKKRKYYSPEYKAEALKLALKIGAQKAAEELGLYDSQIYNWRKAEKVKESTTDRESALATENVKLKRQLAIQAEELEILKKAATYFAKNQK